MKKLLLLLSLLALLNHTYAQVSCNPRHNVTGKNSYVGSTVNGLKEGIWKVMSYDGFTVSETNYTRGIKKGDYYQYSTHSKQIIIEGQYVNNMRDGEWAYYGEYSGLVDKILFYKRGVIIKKY